mgnify:CR=1 FL=1
MKGRPAKQALHLTTDHILLMRRSDAGFSVLIASIYSEIEDWIDKHPDCSPHASIAVDRLLLLLTTMGQM